MVTGDSAGRRAAFFDLDKTIIAKSSVAAFGGSFYRAGLIRKRTLAQGMYAQVVYMLVGADESKMERMRESMLTLTRGWDHDRVSGIVRETLEDVLSPIIYEEALELIEAHRAAGDLTVIISSSPVEVVQPLADFLGVDRAIATRAAVGPDGRYTGELEFYAYGPHKAEAIAELAERESLDLAGSWAYSDSITDLPMLELVGNPVVVNPDRELARTARDRGWEVRAFQHPVRLRDRMPVPGRPTIAVGTVLAAGGTVAVGYLLWRRRARDAPDPGAGLLRRGALAAAASIDALRYGARAVASAGEAVHAALGPDR